MNAFPSFFFDPAGRFLTRSGHVVHSLLQSHSARLSPSLSLSVSLSLPRSLSLPPWLKMEGLSNFSDLCTTPAARSRTPLARRRKQPEVKEEVPLPHVVKKEKLPTTSQKYLLYVENCLHKEPNTFDKWKAQKEKAKRDNPRD